MPSSFSALEILLVVGIAITFLPAVAAFGAGDIPDYAFLEGKAFRHGDVESCLLELYKNHGNLGGGPKFGGAAGFMVGVASALIQGKGQKFSSNDLKRVYFGNWLRDYSQAIDIAGLSKLTHQSLITVISILGFLTFGYATEEFEVTKERLGCYLCVEHIDNPKGYAAKEGDARRYHPGLRPPVENREMELNHGNGMKNYIMSENQGYDTSTNYVRRVLTECINKGRESKGQKGPVLYEAYRLLGTGLHVLEDLLAHSNWCELQLLKMGHQEVFCHVGENVKVNSPAGQVPPLVTGTFGGADFLHSLLGEGQDHFSESSINDLTSRMEKAKRSDGNSIDAIKALVSQIPASGGQNRQEQMQQGENIKNSAVDLDFDKIAPEELQQRLLAILKWRDGTMRDISGVVEKIPGLSGLLERINLALMEYVFTTIEPWLTPLLQRTVGVLKEGSEAVINTDDQFEVFNNPDASDPTHSMLSKDHFNKILNEPAGKVAKVVVQHTVNIVVNCWFDESASAGHALNKILDAVHHPHYAGMYGPSEIQNAMAEEFSRWFGSLGSDQGEVLSRLSKEGVREGRNTRIARPETNYAALGTQPGYIQRYQ